MTKYRWRNGRSVNRAAWVGVACALAGAGAYGGGAPSIPGSVNPGQLEKQFQPLTVPKAASEGYRTPSIPSMVAPAGAKDATFVLHGVVIEGARVFGTEDLRALYADRIGKTISVQDVYDLAAAITAKYTGAGYILCEAVVVPQTIGEAGIVRLRVIEGYVAKVEFTGDAGASAAALLREYGAKIAAERPLKLSTLERYLLLANDLPGGSASGTLKPSVTPGAADLVFDFHQHTVDAVANIDNRGGRYLGPWRLMANVGVNGLVGVGDRTEGTFAGTPTHMGELKYGQVRHTELLGADGTTLSVDGSYTQSHAGYTLLDYDIRGYGRTYGLEVAHPLIRSRSQNLTVKLRFDLHNEKMKEYGSFLASDDRLRAMRVSADYDWADAWLGWPAANLMRVAASQGLDALGAHETGYAHPSVAGGHSNFLKTEFSYTRQQQLAAGWGLEFGVAGQVSRTRLLSSEQFTYGGMEFGRGYDGSALSGDHGLAGKLELHYAVPSQPLIAGLQLYAFADGGQVWQNHATEGMHNDHLFSAGGGARVGLTDWSHVAIELAKPLTRLPSSAEGNGCRGFVNLVVQY